MPSYNQTWKEEKAGSTKSAPKSGAGKHAAVHSSRDPSSSSPLFLQPKLSINKPGDQYEQEADRVADQVISNQRTHVSRQVNSTDSIQRKCACEGSGHVCDACRQDELRIQRKASQSFADTGSPGSAQTVLRTPGRPLDRPTRNFFEPRMGRSFDDVRVHTDAAAAESARSIGALAYTSGNHVVFDHGQYDPQSRSGAHLLAHELTHVVQQRGISASVVQRQPQKANAERETSFLGTGWTDVNELGIVYKEGSRTQNGGVNLHEAPDGPVTEWLPQQTKLFILREHAPRNWYAVTVQDSGSLGYVNRDYVWRNLPDPQAEVLKVKSGDTVIRIAATHYAGFNKWGKDERYVVNALVYVNSLAKHNTKSAPIIYKKGVEVGSMKMEKGDVSGPWALATVNADGYIWLPSPEYMNAVYEEVRKKGGGTGSITADLWYAVADVYHAAAYLIAFIGGLIHGFLASLYDTIAGLASMLYHVLKSVVTLSVVSDVRELISNVEKLTWDQVKDAVGEWAAEWSEKLHSDSPWTAGHAHGYLVGYVIAEAVMLLLSFGETAELKGAIWSTRLGTVVKDSALLRRAESVISKGVELPEKVSEALAKTKTALSASKAGKVVVVAGEAVEWTARGIVKALSLPGEIAQYLTEKAIQGLQKLAPAVLERIKALSQAAKRWLFGCHSPCDCDIEKIEQRLSRLYDEDIEGLAEEEFGRAQQRGEAAAIGSEIELMEAHDWAAELEAQGYRAYPKNRFGQGRIGNRRLSEIFPDKRVRPELIAIDDAEQTIIVGDVTAQPGGTAKIPGRIGQPEGMHLDKTIEYARQLRRNLPPEMRKYRVFAQDKFWQRGGRTKLVPVQ
jgi:hypothetical protein